MTTDELRLHLIHLIETYVTDSILMKRLLALAERDEVPAKGVLVKSIPYLSGRVTDADARLIEEVAFNFC
ncbi:hypothetical protein [Paraburkholderia antibiotica]|uniref:Uncharacterized protein n=1 Tax=Paraburkholderia antibiotica TaxID=2728839 RepID=A0A7Y0A2H4_9BURK|nr:hypothetical protein [Paraburkholderia antibiotica]NML35218.1 hypothetical protein [Paraburkholderia antibiotica]